MASSLAGSKFFSMLQLATVFILGTMFGSYGLGWREYISCVARLTFLRRLNKRNPNERLPHSNEHCPGFNSENAGRDTACKGCPNQNICSSKDPKDKGASLESEEVNRKLKDVKKKILILSGKGGVGKSTVSSQLAWLFQKREFLVGLLDIDVCGPSIPTMTGTRDQDVHASADGWTPVYVRNNLAVMSVGFLLPQEDDAVIWRGPKKNGLIRQFLTDVQWNELDLLIIDTPPGTSDEHLSIVTYLNPATVDGAIIVTTPQHVALRDVRKEINFCKKVGVRIIGVVENMTESIFTEGGSDAVQIMCKEMDVRYMGTIPMDRDLLHACENGKSVFDVNCFSASASHLNTIADDVLTHLHLPLSSNNPSLEDHSTARFTTM